MNFKFNFLLGAILFPMSMVLAQIAQVGESSKFGYVINTSSEESAPKLRREGETLELYFVRTFDVNNTGGELDQDIWLAVKDIDGVWSLAKNMDNINNINHNSIGTIVGDKMYVLFSNKRNKQSSIGIAQREPKEMDRQSKWSKPKSISSALNLPNGAVDFCVSSDEKFLVLSKTHQNEFMQQDLFVYDLEKQKLSLIGEHINTPGIEMAPFLTKGNDTLFFASNGHPGWGDFDIYYSVRGKSMLDWSEPVNLGARVNSSGFDAYFTLFENTAVWSSNRDGEHADLFYAQVHALQPFKISIQKKDVSVFQGRDGFAQVLIDGGVSPYKIQWSTGAMKENIEQLEKGVYSVMVTDATGKRLQEKVQVNAPNPKSKDLLTLPEIHYELGSWKFIQSKTVNSIDSLKAIAQLLRDYPKLKIELWSHTDCRGSKEENLTLAQQRANAVYTYLVKKENINGQRIIPIGKGEEFPRYMHDSLTHTQIQLTEQYILQVASNNEELQEKLHQLNRRTEAKIIDDNFKVDPTKNYNNTFLMDIE